MPQTTLESGFRKTRFRFRWADSLVSFGRKKKRRFKNIRFCVDGASQSTKPHPSVSWNRYCQTPLYGDLHNTDTTDGQFALSLGKESPYIFYKFNWPLPSSKNPHFQNEAEWKWVLFAWEWKIICISKAEHLTSFWYRGPGELGNGTFFTPSPPPPLSVRIDGIWLYMLLCSIGLNIPHVQYVALGPRRFRKW